MSRLSIAINAYLPWRKYCKKAYIIHIARLKSYAN